MKCLCAESVVLYICDGDSYSLLHVNLDAIVKSIEDEILDGSGIATGHRRRKSWQPVFRAANDRHA